MKILHIGLLSCFTEGMLYQDNLLAEMNCKAGHEVIFVTNTEKYVDGVLVDVGEEDTVLPNGMRLIRLKYDNVFNSFITKKIQKCRRIKELMEEIRPDSIMYHGCCGYELMDVSEYVKRNSEVKFYVDSHEDFNNTARNWIARFAYKYIHGMFIKKALPEFDKVLSISYETSKFLMSMYHIPTPIIEDYPLGGVIMEQEAREEYREEIIKKYCFQEDVIILGHSGKMIKEKKTKELLQALIRIDSDKLRLIIFGVIPKENQELEHLINKDKRVVFAGWVSGAEQHKLLGAIDLYCQPGSQSATAEIAVCDGCALMLGRHRSYRALYEDNAFYAESIEEITNVLNKIVENPETLDVMKEKGMNTAKSKLDYKVLAERYLH